MAINVGHCLPATRRADRRCEIEIAVLPRGCRLARTLRLLIPPEGGHCKAEKAHRPTLPPHRVATVATGSLNQRV